MTNYLDKLVEEHKKIIAAEDKLEARKQKLEKKIRWLDVPHRYSEILGDEVWQVSRTNGGSLLCVATFKEENL